MDIEKNLIGALIKKPALIPEVAQIIKKEDFQGKQSSISFPLLVSMVEKGEDIDLITAAKNMIGLVDMSWLMEASDDCISPSFAKKHAVILAKQGKARRLKRRLTELASRVDPLDPDITLSAMLDVYTAELSGDEKQSDIKSAVGRFKNIISDNSTNTYGVDTGYEFMSDKFIKYMPGHVWVVGAFTSVGKTATMIDMVCRVAQLSNPKIAIISTEMTEEQNIARMVSNLTGFHSQVVLSGRLHGSNTEEQNRAVDWVSGRNITIYDDIYSLQDIEMRLRALTMTGNVDVVYLDYLQNMTFTGAKSDYESMSGIAKGLQRIAKQLKTCIVCLSQLSNESARNDDLIAYKGAGEIAAVADLGVRLNRDREVKEKLLFRIDKNRHGQTGKQVLKFINNYTRLKEIDDPDNE